MFVADNPTQSPRTDHAHVAQARRMRPAIASWYGPGLYGHAMACPGAGTLQPGTLGVANKTLSCWTKLRLCFRACVTVRVLDRGPYVGGRDFDLTDRTRVAVGMPKGVKPVRYRIIG